MKKKIQEKIPKVITCIKPKFKFLKNKPKKSFFYKKILSIVKKKLLFKNQKIKFLLELN